MNQKIVIVTGASSGIGKAIAKKLITSNEYFVYCVARRIKMMEDLKGKNSAIEYLDVADEKSITALIDKVMNEKKRIDYIINNAGFGVSGPFEAIPLAEGKKIIDVNLMGAASLMQKGVRIMRKQDSGMILNVTSIVGKFAIPFSSWYCASKHALLALSESVKYELKNSNVKIVAIEPGLIKTNFFTISTKDASTMDKKYSSFYQKNADNIEDRNAFAKKSGSDPIVIANLIAKVMKKSNPNARYHAGHFSHISLFLRRILSDKLFYKICT